MLEVRRHGGVRALSEAGWDALVGEGSPFLEWTFLAGLEATGCVGEGTGWLPAPVTAWRDGRLVGAAPAYVKHHSLGEFVYDWSVADWARRRGLRWYPKVVVAVPFTPVTGRRLLVAPGEDEEAVRAALLGGLSRGAEGASGVHLLFPDEGDAAFAVRHGAAERLQVQHHWRDHGFGTFDGWLASLPTKQRGEVRRERRRVAPLRIEAGMGVPADLPLWEIYDATYRRHTGEPGYLTPAFFDWLRARWAHRLHTVVARDGAEVVAGTLNVRKGDRLYGRYWGALREVPLLHFEVSYYAAIAWCLENGVRVFEPGHGGEHKAARGFDPVITRSAHLHADPRVHAALADAYAREAAAVRAAYSATTPTPTSAITGGSSGSPSS